jgi:hypothetical protein
LFLAGSTTCLRLGHGKFVPVQTFGIPVAKPHCTWEICPNQNTPDGGLENGLLNKGGGGGKIKALEKTARFFNNTLNTNNQTPKQKEN